MTTTLYTCALTVVTLAAFATLLHHLHRADRNRHHALRHIVKAPSGLHQYLYHGLLARHFRDWSQWTPPAPELVLVARSVTLLHGRTHAEIMGEVRRVAA